MKKHLSSFLFLTFIISTNVFAESLDKATFAGGCFWCVEAGFENAKADGIRDVVSGYAGGTGENPTYDDYAQKGHVEVVQITYDKAKINYAELLDLLWRQIDPTDTDGQFVDRGLQYRPVIFYHNEEQKKLAETAKEALQQSGRYPKKVSIEILEATKFYPAEEHHQNYHNTHAIKYKYYRFRSGRDQYLEKIWGKTAPENKEEKKMPLKEKPSSEELKKKLTPLQYSVTQKEGTERPFDNEYWNNKQEGIYVDIVSGEPLFSSKDKYDSGTGWPSFTKPLESGNIVEKEDRKFFAKRVEIRSKNADSHLGHVFPDGPKPTGLRYCMNSAAMRFIPKEHLQKEGYDDYKMLFNN